MNIAFLGKHSSLNPYNIGGVESYARRLAKGLFNEGDKVDYLLFDCDTLKEEKFFDFAHLYYFRKFNRALSKIENTSYDGIVTFYIPPKYQLIYTLFRRRHWRNLKFINLHAIYSTSLIKKTLRVLFSHLYYHLNFTTSPLLSDFLTKNKIPNILLLPPVPESYFCSLEKKSSQGKLRISYVGRIDIDKGVFDIFDLFSRLKKEKLPFETQIYGYYHPHSKSSQKLHRFLRSQNVVRYNSLNWGRYSPRSEEKIQRVLQETDILVLAYKDLFTTLNPPLVLLEGLASLCLVISTRIGDIESITGVNDFIIDNEKDSLYRILKKINREIIFRERLRIYNRNLKLKFGLTTIAKKFREVLKRELS